MGYKSYTIQMEVFNLVSMNSVWELLLEGKGGKVGGEGRGEGGCLVCYLGVSVRRSGS